MRGADLCQRAVTDDEVMVAAEGGIRHDRHVVLSAPRQEITLNASICEAVRDLIGCATIAVWNTEQVLHLARVEVGDAPGADLFRRTQLFECRHDAGEFGSRNW